MRIFYQKFKLTWKHFYQEMSFLHGYFISFNDLQYTSFQNFIIYCWCISLIWEWLLNQTSVVMIRWQILPTHHYTVSVTLTFRVGMGVLNAKIYWTVQPSCFKIFPCIRELELSMNVINTQTNVLDSYIYLFSIVNQVLTICINCSGDSF